MEDLPVISEGVALLICETPSLLEEALVKIDLKDIPHHRINPKAILVPEPFAKVLSELLRKQGVYPRVEG